MVDESSRIWINIDDIRKTLSDHCIRLTRVEDYHYNKDKGKQWNLTIILSTIIAIEAGLLIFDHLS